MFAKHMSDLSTLEQPKLVFANCQLSVPGCLNTLMPSKWAPKFYVAHFLVFIDISTDQNQKPVLVAIFQFLRFFKGSEHFFQQFCGFCAHNEALKSAKNKKKSFLKKKKRARALNSLAKRK